MSYKHLALVGVVLGMLFFGLASSLASSRTTQPSPQSTPARAAAGPGNCTAKPRPGSWDISINSAGQQRKAWLHVPRNAPVGKRLPVVFGFHGSGTYGEFFERESGLSRVSDRSGFLVVYPNASGSHPFWSLNDQARNARQDVQYVSDLIDWVEQNMCVDSKRIYATGVSNGGGFTARIGCRLSTRWAAIAPVAGGYKAIPDCDAKRPLSVLEIHGTADRAVPYFGSPPDYRGSVPRYLAGWRTRDRCASRGTSVRMGAGTLHQAWGRCATGTRVEHIKRWARPHEWPGAFGGPGMSGAQMVWNFFRTIRGN